MIISDFGDLIAAQVVHLGGLAQAEVDDLEALVERRGAEYDEQHLQLLSVVAAQLGGYLTNVRLQDEEELHATFGADYERYAEATPSRLLPFVW